MRHSSEVDAYFNPYLIDRSSARLTFDSLPAFSFYEQKKVTTGLVQVNCAIIVRPRVDPYTGRTFVANPPQSHAIKAIQMLFLEPHLPFWLQCLLYILT